MIGIELEIEAKGESILPKKNDLTYWEADKDGSLLNGVEYRLIRPLRGDELAGAIDEMFQKPHKFERYMTGSTHIHLDMTEEATTAEIVKNITFMMYCLESVIFQITDPTREYCGYTNKLISAPETLIGAILNASEEDGFKYLKDLCADHYNIGRFYGLNVLALAQFGSIEFRYFPTAVSREELEAWIRLVMQIKQAAAGVSITQMIDIFNSEERYEQFINTYFAEWRDDFLRYVPATTAAMMAQKAIAVSQSCTSRQVSTFDPKAVLENNALKKFVKKVPDNQEPYPFITKEAGQRAPNATSLPTTLLFNLHSGELLCNIAGRELGWHGAHGPIHGFTNKNHFTRVLKTLDTIIKNPEIDIKIRDIAQQYYRPVARNLDNTNVKLPLRKNDPAMFVARMPDEVVKNPAQKMKIEVDMMGELRQDVELLRQLQGNPGDGAQAIRGRPTAPRIQAQPRRVQVRNFAEWVDLDRPDTFEVVMDFEATDPNQEPRF
jgi:hypothetical protein